MGWKKRILSCLLAAVLAVGALAVGGSAAGGVEIYIVAENDQFVELPLEAMPTWIDGILYVPYHVFDWSYAGVNLGVSYGQEQNGSRYIFTLYSLNGTLVFDVNAGTCAEAPSGAKMDMRAVVRGSRVFVPLAGVCRYFGLQYSYTPTNYGTLIRITNGQEVMSTARFVDAATNSMRVRYNNYMQQINAASSSPRPTPTQGESAAPTEQPDQRQLSVALAFQCTGDGAQTLLDALEGAGVRALFLFTPDALAANEAAVRRAIGSGHTVGLSVSGASPAAALAEAEEGAAWLERRLFFRPHIVQVEGDETGEAASALAEAGWACWSGSVDARDDGRSQSVQRYALLGALEDRRGRVNVLLDDSQAVIGYLSQALSQMARAGYTFRLTVETDL